MPMIIMWLSQMDNLNVVCYYKISEMFISFDFKKLQLFKINR